MHAQHCKGWIDSNNRPIMLLIDSIKIGSKVWVFGRGPKSWLFYWLVPWDSLNAALHYRAYAWSTAHCIPYSWKKNNDTRTQKQKRKKVCMQTSVIVIILHCSLCRPHFQSTGLQCMRDSKTWKLSCRADRQIPVIRTYTRVHCMNLKHEAVAWTELSRFSSIISSTRFHFCSTFRLSAKTRGGGHACRLRANCSSDHATL